MSDADLRLERLERLTRLRDSGALSADEFAVEKRRVLMGEQVAAPARTVTVEPRADTNVVAPVVEARPYQDPDDIEPEPRRRFPFVKVIAGVAVASAVAAAAFINTTPSDVPGRSPPKARPASRTAVVPPVVAPVTPLAVAGVDVTPALRFRDAQQCSFASATDKLFDTLLPEDDNGDRTPAPRRATVAGLDLPVVASTEAADDVAPGGRVLKASVRFPEGTRWNALKMSRLVRQHGDFPETDDTDTRMLTFLNPAEDVQAAMKLVGASVPIAPQSREIDNSGGSCGGSMQVLPVTGGSALICRWSC